MRVRLDFTVSHNGLPALLIIRDFSGELILYKRVYFRHNRLCFCSESRNLIITVRPVNADFYELSYFIKLGCCSCYHIRSDFTFTANNERWLQTFSLYDETYMFPVKNARLYFSGGG